MARHRSGAGLLLNAGHSAAAATGQPGSQLLEETTLAPATLDRLFALLLLTMAGVLLAGNLERMQASALRSSLLVALPCGEMALLVYTSARLARSLAAALLPCALLALVTFARSPLALIAFHALAAAALVYTLRTCRPRGWRELALAALCASLAIVGIRTGITSFDMLARLNAGNVHQDTLFHASIAAMLRHYGVASTGLNGLVVTPYHFFSHLLMAALADVSGASVIEVYGVASWVLFAPLLVFALVAWSAMLARLDDARLPWLWALAPVLLWFAALVLQPFGVTESPFTSESYLVSLSLLLAGQVPLFQRRLRAIDLAIVLVLSATIASAKISVGAIYAGLWATRLVMLRGGEWRRVAVATLLSGAVTTAIVWRAAAEATGQSAIDPLHYVRTFSWLGPELSAAVASVRGGPAVPPATWVLACVAVLAFVALHFLPTWLVAWRSVRTCGLRSATRAPVVVLSVAAAAAGMAVAALLKIAGGSAYFFTNVAFFVALPALLPLAVEWLAQPARAHWSGPALAAAVLLGPGLQILDHATSVDHRVRAPNPLIEQLQALREHAPVDVVLRANAAMLAANPIHWCTARPFVFPAVSERAWVGVIEPRPRRLCAYENYDYERYGLAGDDQQVVRAPVLLPGMSVQAH